MLCKGDGVVSGSSALFAFTGVVASTTAGLGRNGFNGQSMRASTMVSARGPTPWSKRKGLADAHELLAR
eukprot:6354689-Alexandrium_andersonii.AAC.1